MDREVMESKVSELLEKMYGLEGKIRAYHDLGIDYHEEVDLLCEATERMCVISYDLAESRLLCAKYSK